MLGGVRVCIIMSKYKTHKVNEISQQRMCVCVCGRESAFETFAKIF